jgi:hypothetical protein
MDFLKCGIKWSNLGEYPNLWIIYLNFNEISNLSVGLWHCPYFKLSCGKFNSYPMTEGIQWINQITRAHSNYPLFIHHYFSIIPLNIWQ